MSRAGRATHVGVLWTAARAITRIIACVLACTATCLLACTAACTQATPPPPIVLTEAWPPPMPSTPLPLPDPPAPTAEWVTDGAVHFIRTTRGIEVATPALEPARGALHVDDAFGHIWFVCPNDATRGWAIRGGSVTAVSMSHRDGSHGFTYPAGTELSTEESRKFFWQALYSASCDDVWVGGRTLAHWQKGKWALLTNPLAGSEVQGLFGTGPNDIYATVREPMTGQPLGPVRHLLHYNGRAWAIVEITGIGRVETMFGLDRDHWWAVGQEASGNRAVVVTLDHGTWSALTVPDSIAFRHVHASSPARVFATTYDALYALDASRVWQRVPARFWTRELTRYRPDGLLDTDRPTWEGALALKGGLSGVLVRDEEVLVSAGAHVLRGPLAPEAGAALRGETDPALPFDYDARTLDRAANQISEQDVALRKRLLEEMLSEATPPPSFLASRAVEPHSFAELAALIELRLHEADDSVIEPLLLEKCVALAHGGAVERRRCAQFAVIAAWSEGDVTRAREALTQSEANDATIARFEALASAPRATVSRGAAFEWLFGAWRARQTSALPTVRDFADASALLPIVADELRRMTSSQSARGPQAGVAQLRTMKRFDIAEVHWLLAFTFAMHGDMNAALHERAAFLALRSEVARAGGVPTWFTSHLSLTPDFIAWAQHRVAQLGTLPSLFQREGERTLTLRAVTPAVAKPGDTIVIDGGGFMASREVHVVVGGTYASVMSRAPFSISVRVPAMAVDGEIQVIGWNESASLPFSVGRTGIAPIAKSNVLVLKGTDADVNTLLVSFHPDVDRAHALDVIDAHDGEADMFLSLTNEYVVIFRDMQTPQQRDAMRDALAKDPFIKRVVNNSYGSLD